ncbi:MAG: tyrosine recombinase XerC [Clostridiales bacterium]|nr:tyrosine recombinase XerC [Clostridiales bacterium]
MAVNYKVEAPRLIKDFLSYHQNILNHSPRTVEGYYLDLRMFFRYIKISRDLATLDEPFDEISIDDVDEKLICSVTPSDILDFLDFLSNERSGIRKLKTRDETNVGLTAVSRARKLASIRSFYGYLTKTAHVAEHNPAEAMDNPKLKKSLPHFLHEDECDRLLDAVKGPFEVRDYCILLLFLSCGLRVSELVGLNVSDVSEDSIRVHGKGNKDRLVFITPEVREAIDEYLAIRDETKIDPGHENALFISRNFRRISVRGVQKMVEKNLKLAGLDATQISTHKLRHTAATLMLQNGVDVRTLQDVLGHESLNTTQIYTHVEDTGLREAARANPIAKRKRGHG